MRLNVPTALTGAPLKFKKKCGKIWSFALRLASVNIEITAAGVQNSTFLSSLSHSSASLFAIKVTDLLRSVSASIGMQDSDLLCYVPISSFVALATHDRRHRLRTDARRTVARRQLDELVVVFASRDTLRYVSIQHQHCGILVRD